MNPTAKQYAKNSFVKDGVIYKMVFFDPYNGLVRDVHRCDRGPKDDPDTGTYQGILVGDMYYASTYNTKTHERTIGQYHVNKSAKIDDLLKEEVVNSDILPLIQAITPTLKEWLLSSQDDPFLPTGIGWDGKFSFADHVKHENGMWIIRGLSDEDGKEVASFRNRYYKAIHRTPKDIFRRGPHLLDLTKIGAFKVTTDDADFLIRRVDNNPILEKVEYDMEFNPDISDNYTLVKFNRTSDGHESLTVRSFNFR